MQNEPIVSRLYAHAFCRPHGFVSHNVAAQGWIMVYVYEGHVEFHIKGETLTLRSGDTVLIPPGVARRTLFLAEQNRFACFFFSLLSGDLSRGICHLPATEQSRAIMQEVFFALEGSRDDNCRNFAALYGMLSLFRSRTPIPERYRPLLPVIRFIDCHYNKSHKIGEYAAMAAMSETAFRRLFSEYTGLSPVDYRNRLRLRHAEALILDGSTVAEAACAVGFAGTSPYYRILKRNRG